MKSVTIDRKRPLRDEPKTGHNRWHPDIPPIVEVDEGEEVSLETRVATDGYLTSRSTEADFAAMDAGAIHPLTGPVLVKGARPGDLLEVEFVDIVPQPWAFTAIMPGLGFLRDIMTIPFLVHWDIADGWATSRQLRGVRIPGASFMGVSGWRRRARSWRRGRGARPTCSRAAAWCSRPMPLARCPPRAPRPFMDCGRCRHARTAGTST